MRDSRSNFGDSHLDSISKWLGLMSPADAIRIERADGDRGSSDTGRSDGGDESSRGEKKGSTSEFIISLPNQAAVRMVWNPVTLKDVLDHALRLSRMVEKMPATMAFLAEKEHELRTLRNLILAPVKKVSVHASSAICITCDDRPMVLGRWVPDLIDRAGGRYLLLEPGDEDVQMNVSDILSDHPDVLFLVRSELGPKPESSILSQADELINAIGFDGAVYLMDKECLTFSSPDLYQSIAIFAAGLHPDIEGLDDTRRALIRIR